MAFSMTQIKRETSKQTHYSQQEIRRCFATIKGVKILTNNVIYALQQYTTYRLKQRRLAEFNYNQLLFMIQELLEKCCDKCFLTLTKQDVEINEKELLFQIKCAIYYGATKHIYFNHDTGVINTDKLRQNILPRNRKEVAPPQRIPLNTKVEADYVKAYFKELEI